MHESFIELLTRITTLIELLAAVLLILGFVIATAIWIGAQFGTLRAQARTEYRRAIARVVLIGLEVLVAATIIKTVTLKPTVESMGILVAIVAIRTALGWTISLEKNGRWPWQKRDPRSG